MDIKEDQYTQEARLGIDCDRFLASSIGKYLWGRVDEQVESAEIEFRSVDVHDSNAVQKIQNNIRVAELFKIWMLDAIQQGQVAEDVIEREG